jgi:hypothetical protein
MIDDKTFCGPNEYEELYLSFDNNQAELTEPVNIDPTVASLRVVNEYDLRRLDHLDALDYSPNSVGLDEKTRKQI